MYSLIQLKTFVSCGRDPARSLPLGRGFLLIPLILACLAFLPQMQAAPQVLPTPIPGNPDGCYPGFTTAEGCNALHSLTTGAGNTGVGWYSLYLDHTGSYNTGLGGGTLVLNSADSNTATGAAALLLNGDGTQNCAYGTDALVYNSYLVPAPSGANYNDAFGAFALFNNSDGYENNAVGNHALFENLHGAGNTAVGDLALQNNDSSGNAEGNINTAVGASALAANVDGDSNNAVGYSAAQNVIDGSQNNAMGTFALLANNGAANTVVGDSAFMNAATGSFNTIIGWHTGSNANVDGMDNIYIGATAGPASGAENGAIRIGDTAFIAGTWIAGIFGQTAPAGIPVVVSATGKLGTVVSSARFKDDIKPMDKASEAIFALNPVTFHYKKQLDANGTPQFGLVAEEVAKVNPDLVVSDPNGKPYTVRYEAVNAMLLNEFLKEHRTVQDLKATAEKQQATIALQENQIKALTASLKEQATQIQKVSAQLEMIKPTPQVVENR
jgi:hypothetical protein